MVDRIVPHFHNDAGVGVIEIGAREFMCVGALPPFDHPHVFLDMGGDTEIICPYCSTLYRLDATLAPNAARRRNARFPTPKQPPPYPPQQQGRGREGLADTKWLWMAY
jgi:uncharacterized Zn-finger protein